MAGKRKKTSKSIRKMPTQTRARATYEVILDATARVLVEDGFDRASTNRVADRAGVSIGSLYQYFPNKEVMEAALMRRQFARKLHLLEFDEERAAADVKSLIREVITGFVNATFDEPEIHKVFIEQVPRGPGSPQMEFEGQCMALLVPLMELHRNELRPIPIERMAYFVFHSVQGVMHAHMTDKRGHDNATLIDETCLLLEGYMLA
jgi:AcrR family transcriptional regulator